MRKMPMAIDHDETTGSEPVNTRYSATRERPLDWRKRMSDSIAYALLVYTGLQIFMTVGALRGGTGSLLPYFALILLIIAIIPACRRFERCWARLSDAEAADPALAPAFRRDQLAVWALAIGLPFALCGMFRMLRWMFAD